MSNASTDSRRVRYSDGDVARSVANRRIKNGAIVAVKVIKKKSSIHKDSGDSRIMLTLAPLDGEGNTRKPTLPMFFKMPWPTTPEDLQAAQLPLTREDGSPFQKEVPNSGFSLYNYLKTTRPELAPALPKYDPSVKRWSDSISEATYSTKGDMEARKRELMTPTFDFWNGCFDEGLTGEGDTLLGDEFVAKVTYNAGSDFPNVEILGTADKVGDQITPWAEATEVVG